MSFDAEGCGATRAATAAVAEMVDGEPVVEAARIGTDEVDAALGGLTPAKRHAAQLAADALHRALAAPRRPRERLAAPREGRVLVAMSGGVDSAVAALLERERGADVLGVTLKLWADPETDGAKACCSPEAVLGARAVAHSLGIPHLTLDLEEEFRRRVVGAFLSGYGAGATPNPASSATARCGSRRWSTSPNASAPTAWSPATTRGSSTTATARCSPPPPTAAKDQSYMLAALPPAMLDRLRFPLTELTKPEVREIAARHGLASPASPRARTSASSPARARRGSCAATAASASARAPCSTAPAAAIGRHRGHHNFTVGQRRGIGVSSPEPLYVLATDAAANTVTVGTREELAATRVRSATRSCTATANASTRSGSLPLAAVPAAVAGAGPGATPSSRSSSASRSTPPPPARRRCCSPARRSSATARSPDCSTGLWPSSRSPDRWRPLSRSGENSVPFSPLTCFLLSPLQAWPGALSSCRRLRHASRSGENSVPCSPLTCFLLAPWQ